MHILEQPSVDARDLAKASGISLTILRSFRKSLARGTDWDQSGRLVFFSASGVEKLARSFQLQAADLLPASSPGITATVISSPKMIGDVRTHYPNRRLIQCELETGEKVMVAVKESAKYSPRLRDGSPMKITVHRKEGRWAHRGRAPRYPGVW